MLAVPLPFVVSLLLVLLLVKVAVHDRPIDRAAAAFVGACAILMTIVGVRWTFGGQAIRFLQPIAASFLPPVAWICFAGLAGSWSPSRLWRHAIPVIIVIILTAIRQILPLSVDLALAVLFLGYGLALLRLGSAGPDALAAARLADSARAHKAMIVVGLGLIGSGIVDLLIAGDFRLYQGVHAAAIVTTAQTLILPLLAYAVAVAGSSSVARYDDDLESGGETKESSESDPPEPPGAIEPDDVRIVATLDRAMLEKRLFRDPELSLNRLARRVGIPSRQVSAAINRTFGRNVSQVVNEYRIAEARRLLADPALSITAVMFESGFQTKSNFNREFLRVTGMNPTAYRRSISRSSGGTEPIPVEAPSPGRR